jgi:predicted peptidase
MLKVFKQKKNELIPFVYQYFLSVPPNYNNDDKNKKWPLLLFLHGVGESYPPIEKLLKHGPPKLIHAYSTNRDNTHPLDDSNLESAKFLAENFVTCSPQVNEGYGWNNQVLINLIDQIQQNYNIDQNKIYLTGLSMGKFINIYHNKQIIQKKYFI